MVYGLEWLTGPSQPAGPIRPKTSDGGQIAPDRTTREACYTSRDIFFSCLDKHDILDAVKDDEKARTLCKAENEMYERDCARSWIKYFKEKRVMEWKRDRTIEKIQADDKVMAEKARERGRGKGWFQ